jgi:uncharacterized membrane protein YjfL (UPF0719 family)
MSNQVIGIVSGVVHFLLSLFLALLTTYGSFRLFDKLTRDVDEVKELKSNNVAVGIVLASMLLAAAIIVKQVTSPAISTLQAFLFQDPTWFDAVKSIVFICGYIVIAILIAVGSIWIALRASIGLTRNLDEMAEVKKNNVAVAIMLGVAIVVMGLFLADGLRSLLDALIPFPTFQAIEVLGS